MWQNCHFRHICQICQYRQLLCAPHCFEPYPVGDCGKIVIFAIFAKFATTANFYGPLHCFVLCPVGDCGKIVIFAVFSKFASIANFYVPPHRFVLCPVGDCGKIVIFAIFAKFAIMFSFLPFLLFACTFGHTSDFVASGLQTEHFLNCLKISVEHQKAVERLTVGQRENPAWQNMRKGRLTASNFGVILKAKRVTPSLMKRVIGEYDLSGVQAISWGITNEAEAVKAFETATAMNVKETGLWLHMPGILGAPPDGPVGKTLC